MFDANYIDSRRILKDGRLSDIFGRKATLCLAMGLFMLGCLLAGFASNIEQLIVFRGIAGVGGGAIISMSQIIISDVVSLRERWVFVSSLPIATHYRVVPIVSSFLTNLRITCFPIAEVNSKASLVSWSHSAMPLALFWVAR